MSLPHVLLGMLEEPASGYDLKQYFERSVRYFWYAELSQIYPTLARLKTDGLLTAHDAPSDKGPQRKIYTRTAKGKKALKDWLMEGPVCRTERLSYLTQVFFLDHIPMSSRLAFMRELKTDFEARLTELQAIDAGWAEQDPRYPDALPPDDLCKYLTLRCGLMKYTVMVEWCEESIQRLSRAATTS